MREIVKDISRHVRYRELTALIGREVRAESLEESAWNVERAVAGWLPELSFSPSDNTAAPLTILRYGIVDLAFNVGGVSWQPSDVAGPKLLHQLGFLPERSDADAATFSTLLNTDDPTCIRELNNELRDGRSVLRVFLEQEPRRDMEAHLISLGSGGLTDEFVRTFCSECFPMRLRITDACLTNAPFVWFHKHFWM